MAPRKMLGSVDHPAIIRLMRMIETQSKETLIRFAAEYVISQYLPLVDDPRLTQAVQCAMGYVSGECALKDVKLAVKEARAAAQSETDPVKQAAARAISTACAVATTSTNALGFAFYGAAAFAYSRAGLKADTATYDALATEELERICAALTAVLVPDEPNPVKVDWGC